MIDALVPMSLTWNGVCTKGEKLQESGLFCEPST